MTVSEKKNSRRKAATRFYIVLAVIFVIGGIIGGIIGGAVKGAALSAAENEEQPLYGTRDGKVITDDGVEVLTL